MKSLYYLFTQALYVAKRKAYAIRLLIPGLRRLHKLEVIVGPRGYWKQSRAYQMEALKRNGLLPEHRLLDLGCGPLQGGVAIIDYLNENRYVGLDIAPLNLNAAYSELSHHELANKKPTLILADDCGKKALSGQRFDFVWASQILCYFDDTMLTDLFEHVLEILEPEGTFLFDIVGECPPEFNTPNHIKWVNSVENHTLESIKALAEPLGFCVKAIGVVKDYGYPSGLNLCNNVLLELTHAAVQPNTNLPPLASFTKVYKTKQAEAPIKRSASNFREPKKRD